MSVAKEVHAQLVSLLSTRPTLETRGELIHLWLYGVRRCMRSLEVRLPTIVRDYNELLTHLHDESEEYIDEPSAFLGEDGVTLKAYNPHVLSQIAQLVNDAALSLEIDGVFSTPSSARPALSLGQRLRRARKFADDKQSTVGELLNVPHQRVSDWEIGKEQPDPELVPQIEAYIKKHSKPEG